MAPDAPDRLRTIAGESWMASWTTSAANSIAEVEGVNVTLIVQEAGGANVINNGAQVLVCVKSLALIPPIEMLVRLSDPVPEKVNDTGSGVLTVLPVGTPNERLLGAADTTTCAWAGCALQIEKHASKKIGAAKRRVRPDDFIVPSWGWVCQWNEDNDNWGLTSRGTGDWSLLRTFIGRANSAFYAEVSQEKTFYQALFER